MTWSLGGNGIQWFFLGKQTCRDKIGIPVFQSLPPFCRQDEIRWVTRPVIFILHVCTWSLLFWLHSAQTEYSGTAAVIDPSCIQLAYIAKACQVTRYHIWLNSKSHNCVEVIRMQPDFNGLIQYMVHAASHCLNAMLSLICPVSRMWFVIAELPK